MLLGLHECKVDNKKATIKNIFLNTEVDVPSGMGGFFTGHVTHIEKGFAKVKTKPWMDFPSQQYQIALHPIFLSLNDLSLLSHLLKSDKINAFTDQEIRLLNIARVGGYVSVYNRWSWTDRGIELLEGTWLPQQASNSQ